jgi:hypothetical protein
MLIVVAVVVALVAGVAFSHAPREAGARKAVLLVAALALGVRLLASVIIYAIASQTHGEGVWLSDEASFFLATEALLPNPLDAALPLGLDHLGGDGYLGLTVVISMLVGAADSNAFRVVNAALGAIVVVVSMTVARQMFGERAGLIAGLGLAVWPTLVLWSATMLRDTLGSFAVVVVWWTLVRAREVGVLRTVGAIFLALVVLLSLRPYLGVAVLTGALAWAAYLVARRLPKLVLIPAAGVAVALGVAVLIVEARPIDFAAHELVYRQTVIRMETLGRLYTDSPPEGELPIRAGAAVAVVTDPVSGWLLTGIVQDFPRPNEVRVAFTDESIRELPLSTIIPIQSAPIPPQQLVAWVVPNLLRFMAGVSMNSEPSSPVWVVSALGWDLLVALAALATFQRRLSASEWLLPLCVVAGTVLALIAIPGAPANVDRHRTTQTIPLLLVLATGVLSSRARSTSLRGATVTNSRTSPSSDPTPASSRMRSAR